jgi:hypothetical protein
MPSSGKVDSVVDHWEIALFLVIFGLVLSAAIRQHARSRRQMEESFAKLEFDTPKGRIAGEQMTVVSRRQQHMDALWDRPGIGGVSESDAFWYCLGPGPSYFLVIPMVSRRWNSLTVNWVVRPLTEERMRAALQGDSMGLQRAFGGNG